MATGDSERRQHRLGLDRACPRHTKSPAIVTPSVHEIARYGKGGSALPDPSGAYSMRGLKRRGTDGGRRGGGRPSGGAAPVTPVPETVSSTMALWIDTDPAYLTLDAGRCSALVSRDANEWVFTAPGASAEPLSQATGFLSQPALYWTTDDYMICTGGLAELLDGTQAYEEFVVGKLDSAGGPGVVRGIGGVGNTSLNQYQMAYFVNGVDTVSRRDSSTLANNGTGYVGADPFIWAHNFSGTLINSWVNDGQTITDGANAKPVAGNVCVLGALRTFGSYNSFFKGVIAEKITYLGVLSTEDRAALWAYFAAKYVGLVVPS